MIKTYKRRIKLTEEQFKYYKYYNRCSVRVYNHFLKTIRDETFKLIKLQKEDRIEFLANGGSTEFKDFKASDYYRKEGYLPKLKTLLCSANLTALKQQDKTLYRCPNSLLQVALQQLEDSCKKWIDIRCGKIKIKENRKLKKIPAWKKGMPKFRTNKQNYTLGFTLAKKSGKFSPTLFNPNGRVIQFPISLPVVKNAALNQTFLGPPKNLEKFKYVSWRPDKKNENLEGELSDTFKIRIVNDATRFGFLYMTSTVLVHEVKKSNRKVLGIDVGVRDFVTFSEEPLLSDHTKSLRNDLKESLSNLTVNINKLRKSLSLKQSKVIKEMGFKNIQEVKKSKKLRELNKILGSRKNYQKIKKKIAKLAKKKSEKVKYFQFNLVHDLVNLNNFCAINVEDLNIAGMTRSSKGSLESPGKKVKQKSGLNREILNLSWGQFFTILETACKTYNIEFNKIDPKHTSQTCSNCNHCEKENREGKVFSCKKCGLTLDADKNAAINISLSTKALTKTKTKTKKAKKGRFKKLNVDSNTLAC